VSELYGVSEEELYAYEILMIEPLLLMNLFKYKDGVIDYVSQTSHYVDKCREYLAK
jgi:hypothetical protein